MVLTLFIVTFLSSSAVGLVYESTKERIEEAKINKKVKALKNVLPDFDNNPMNDAYCIEGSSGNLMFYPAIKDGQRIGTAIETFSQEGFGGDIKLLVGYLPDGTIHNIAILEQQETPGLGDKISPKKSNFLQQFMNKNPRTFRLLVTKDGGAVDGITAATISSRAFCDAVQRSYTYLQKDSQS